MKYHDSMARSAEHLRAALPLMTKQRAALHPASYAVWYEFVSGSNPKLNQALQIHTAGGNTLDEAQTWALYREHVCDLDPALGGKIADGFSQVLDSMATSAAQAGQESARFDNSLSAWVEQLLSNPPAQTQADVLQELLSGTREIRGALSELQQRLDSSQGEIHSLREEVQRARGEALLDALTGLANRRAFDQHLQQCTSNPPGDSALAPCLVLGDIDFFKQVNDSYGHAFGDRVLRAVAQTLKGVAAQADKGQETTIAARVGGEEFAMLLPSGNLQQAQAMAETMRSCVAASRIRRGDTEQDIRRVTISLGVTQLRAGECAETFFKRADRALYASKHTGRNCVTVLAAA
ncbi:MULTISPECIES: GGDEF domain-containing protein [Roseateles]|uniref:diguanylate cyclase n=1 Tax=Roseateles albus TaxID=2987525 RepID=A0ABT5KB26_9BURK|nr:MULTISPECIES: GGDEF domain-containing protein [Roseateles]MCV2358990.1 GGDEF domain-containing protein [Paucibacter sp. TC2R-5]MDC8771140.1 GGDEF domain-containing protein [Roseateles albus]